MAGTIRRPADSDDAPIERFDRVERVVHWTAAALFAVLIVTASALYFSPIMAIFGRRRLVEDVHLAAGLALPIPLIVGLVSRRYRADLRRFNRWSADDRAWMRLTFTERARRPAARARLLDGKFNAGQKLNAAFTAGAVLVMLGTGAIMYWYHQWPLAWRTGATYTHDWLAFAVVVVIAGHISHALRDPEAMRSMWSGTVTRRWAAARARGWLAEVDRGGG